MGLLRGAHGTGAGPRCLEEGFAQVLSGSKIYNSIRTYQQQQMSIYHDHAGSLCMWLIALFQVEMMQWIPLGHVDHRMLGVASGISGMSELCPVRVRFQTGHFGHARA